MFRKSTWKFRACRRGRGIRIPRLQRRRKNGRRGNSFYLRSEIYNFCLRSEIWDSFHWSDPILVLWDFVLSKGEKQFTLNNGCRIPVARKSRLVKSIFGYFAIRPGQFISIPSVLSLDLSIFRIIFHIALSFRQANEKMWIYEGRKIERQSASEDKVWTVALIRFKARGHTHDGKWATKTITRATDRTTKYQHLNTKFGKGPSYATKREFKPTKGNKHW